MLFILQVSILSEQTQFTFSMHNNIPFPKSFSLKEYLELKYSVDFS